MLNLILKEFLVQKKTMFYGFIYILVAAFAFSNLMPNGGAIYSVAPVAVLYLFVIYSSGYDDKNKADIVFNSLPLKREDIVFSKYAAVFFFEAFALLCAAVVGYSCILLKLPFVQRFLQIEDIISTLSGGLIFSAVFYPFYFKFGLNKMKLLNIFLLMALIFLPSFISEYVQKHSSTILVRAVISFIENTSPWVLQSFFLILTGILFLLSLLISMNIYRNKDL